MGDLPDLQGSVRKSLLNYRDKPLNYRKKKKLFPYQGLIFREIRDLETGKSIDKYLFCVFFAFICLSITNFPYAVGWLARELEILEGSL